MIAAESHSLGWIKEKSGSIGKKVDTKLMEKVIKAFSLLEQLRTIGIDLIFKGGTSLILLSENPRRFSIDIDIICNMNPKELPALFDKIIALGTFTSWKDDNERRSQTNAPVGHYKFYYKSAIDSHYGEEPILLDILFTENYYPSVVEQPLIHKWFIDDGNPILVKVPTLDCILGDKLTAFAPTTTGILFTKDRPVEIIKQLFDISFLIDGIKDLNIVKQSFLNISESEIKYRELTCSWKDVLSDSVNACLVISQREPQKEYTQLQRGVSNIINFILSRFNIDDATICAGKTAYLCNTLHKEEMKSLIPYEGPAQLNELEIKEEQYLKFNRLKKTNPEAFYYWYNALKLNS